MGDMSRVTFEFAGHPPHARARVMPQRLPPEPFRNRRPHHAQPDQYQPHFGDASLSVSTRTGTLLTSSTGSANVNTALNAP